MNIEEISVDQAKVGDILLYISATKKITLFRVKKVVIQTFTRGGQNLPGGVLIDVIFSTDANKKSDPEPGYSEMVYAFPLSKDKWRQEALMIIFEEFK